MTEETPEELVDIAYLLRLLSGKKEQARQILAMFVEQTPGFVSEIGKLCQERDWPTVKAKVHAIKSYYGYIGNQTFKQKLDDWEIHLTQSPDSFDHENMLNTLKSKTDAIVKRINEVLTDEF